MAQIGETVRFHGANGVQTATVIGVEIKRRRALYTVRLADGATVKMDDFMFIRPIAVCGPELVQPSAMLELFRDCGAA